MKDLIREKEVRRRLGEISRTTLWRFRRDGIIPAPVVIRKKNYWLDVDINAAIVELAGMPASEVPHAN